VLLVDGSVLSPVGPRKTLALVALLSLTSCHSIDSLFCNGAGCEWTKEEWTRVQSLAAFCDPTDTDPSKPCDTSADVSDPVYAVTPPVDTSNAVQFNDAAVDLGWRFYFDARFSGNATLVDSIGRTVPYARAASGQPTGLYCASCHDPKRAGSDFTSSPNIVSIGAGWYDVNGEQTVNAAFYDLLYWNGRSDSLWSQAAAVSESGVSMNGDRLNTFWMIATYYADAYNAVFPNTPLPASLPKRSEVAAMVVTAMDQANDAKLVVGECKLDSAGACPSACVSVSGACWPKFPLHGKPGRRAGCETRTPAKPAEPASDAYDCVAAETVEGKSVGDTVTQVLVNFGKAIAAYETKLVSLESPFDKFVHEGKDSTWISPAAKRGARLFVGKASCIDCHNGPMLTDKVFHDIGIPQVGDHIPTLADCGEGNTSCDCTTPGKEDTCLPSGAWGGLWKLTLPSNKLRRTSKWGDPPDVPADGKDQTLSAWYCAPTDQSLKGAWRTPSLRDVALTAPYMHDGYYRTLEDVVWHYNNGGTASGTDEFHNSGGSTTGETPDGGFPACAPPDPSQQTPTGRAPQIKPLGLTAEEMSDLVEFLKSLNGKPLHPKYVSPPPEAPPPDAGTDASPPPPDAGTDSGTD
jgi:cytochrome c peroxidase